MSWIKCSERMPDYGQVVSIAVDHGVEQSEPRAGWLELIDRAGPWWFAFYVPDRHDHTHPKPFYRVNRVTHWQPLPSSPEGEK